MDPPLRVGNQEKQGRAHHTLQGLCHVNFHPLEHNSYQGLERLDGLKPVKKTKIRTFGPSFLEARILAKEATLPQLSASLERENETFNPFIVNR
jgi:hypothetical protein